MSDEQALTEVRGVNPEAALAAIRARGARFAAGDRAPDGRKLGLVVEGGALRAVCSAGGVVALEHLGLTEVFDHVYGTSAGAMNASYFVTGQARLGIRIYYEDMNRRAVVNPWRFWKILDLDRLLAQTILSAKRLRLDILLAARSKLHIATLEA
ncbi:MAG TPA: patatin-like phospholipase family protein, partial [Polyangia bacterium]|nr:patatin-like phospholipase family protein [Polyangia bacterium]